MGTLLEILQNFRRAHLLVVGDLMLDRFLWGEVERHSPEAPVPVLRVVSESLRLGGAANVVHNIRSLGARATACGIIGVDDAGKRVMSALRKVGASTRGVFTDYDFQTIQKTRVIASPHHQQIVRLDREGKHPVGAATRKRLRDFVRAKAMRYDGVIISDYGKGTVHTELLRVLGQQSRNSIVCVIDPKKENYQHYRFATLMTPNKSEASEASGIPIVDDPSLMTAGGELLRKWRAKAVLITRGSEGMTLFRPRRQVKHFPTEPRDVFDVTGAGDTVVATCALALACGASFEEAAMIANAAAGFVGDEIGTVAVPIEKLTERIKELR
jgi:D-beta-D-heptose 7-phosphate kinase/D-beta-D-heptose 1-phosphate adenosyltransferase